MMPKSTLTPRSKAHAPFRNAASTIDPNKCIECGKPIVQLRMEDLLDLMYAEMGELFDRKLEQRGKDGTLYRCLMMQDRNVTAEDHSLIDETDGEIVDD